MRLDDYAPRPAHLKWLLDSDPAIRWQVMRDLTGEAPDAIAAERSRIATEGWGAELLARQSGAGTGASPRGWGRTCRGGSRLADYPLQSRRPDGPRAGPREQAGSQDDRPRGQVARVQAARQPAFPSRRDGAVHQREDPGDRLVFQGAERGTGQTTAWRAARRWRLELRSTEKHAALRSIPPSACWKGCSHTNEREANRRSSPRHARGQKIIYSSAACSARCGRAK